MRLWMFRPKWVMLNVCVASLLRRDEADHAPHAPSVCVEQVPALAFLLLCTHVEHMWSMAQCFVEAQWCTLENRSTLRAFDGFLWPMDTMDLPLPTVSCINIRIQA